MNEKASVDMRESGAALLFARLQTSGLGQLLAWCRANPESSEAQLCAELLAGESPMLLDELLKGSSLEAVQKSAKFRAALVQRMTQG